MKRTAKKFKPVKRLILEELEPRRMFSGGIEGLIDADQDNEVKAQYHHLDEQRHAIKTAAEAPTAAEQQTLEIAFVDAALEDYQQIVDDLLNNDDDNRNIEVVVLDRDRNGIDQITNTLQDRDNFDAVHVISHGNDGSIQLGNTTLDADTLPQNQVRIAIWGNALIDSGDILIYGCNLAASEDGLGLIENLAELTGADVAASDDTTGHASLGGDWLLESRVGSVEAGVFASESLIQNYQATLAAPELWSHHHTIDLATASPADNHVVGVTLTEGVDGFNHANAQANGEDVRFYDSAGNALDYYIDYWNNGGESQVWVEVASSGTDQIHLYYGNSSAAAQSDGYATFPFFDDFEGETVGAMPSNWSTNAPDVEVFDDGGNLVLYDGTNNGFVIYNNGGDYADVVIQSSFRVPNPGDAITEVDLVARYQDDDNAISAGVADKDNMRFWYTTTADGYTQIGPDYDISAYNVDDGNWHTQELRVYGDTMEFYLDGDFIGSESFAGTGAPATGATGQWSQETNDEGYHDNFILRPYDVGTGVIGTTVAAETHTYSVVENSSNGTYVATVPAMDSDGDPLTYGITGTAFAIDSNGRITVADSTQLDFETALPFNLTVDVDDGLGGIDSIPITITVTDQPPLEVNSITTADLDSDGYIDAVKITFNNQIQDSSVVADDWDVAGVIGESFSPTTNGDVADDNVIYINFQDNLLHTGVKPLVTYTQDNPADVDLIDNEGDLLDDIAFNPAWWNTDWASRTKITFDNSNSSENLVDFPVLVTLTSADVDFTRIQDGGADIRFVDDDGTLLAHEIESWDDVGETARIWVRVQQIDALSDTDFIYLYYDNGDVADGQNAPGVWNANYEGVWHLGEDVVDEGTTATHAESTSNPNDGTQSGNVEASGQIGDGQHFDGNDVISAGNHSSLDVSTAVTLEAWINMDSDPGKNKWYNVMGTDGKMSLYLGGDSGTKTELNAQFWIDGTEQDLWKIGNVDIDPGEWVHVAVTYDGTDVKGYVNGALDFTSNLPGTIDSSTNDFLIGDWKNPTNKPMEGIIDEVRVSSTDRSLEWLEASYLSQNGSFAFNTFSAAESPTTDAAAPIVSITRADPNPTQASSVTFNVDFSENVVNVDASDFLPYLTGTANADLTVVMGDAGDADDSTYTVTVNNISGNGTVGLDIIGATDIQDAAGNIASITPFVDEAYTVGAAPRVTAISTADLDSDGYIDAVLINFDQAIQDSSVVANDWTVAGATGLGFVSTTNGDVADDDKIYITFDDGLLGTGATPLVTYTQDDPTDADVVSMSGFKLADLNVGQAWWDENWLSRTKVTFDNLASTQHLTDYPVLIRLDSSVVDFDKILAGGDDIRFIDDDGTELAYEIDYWDDVAKTATVWVKVQQIDLGSTTDFIYLYYNNINASAVAPPSDFWPSGVGVYHLDEDPGPGGTGDIKDSDGSANDGTAHAVMESNDLVDGQIGKAIDFEDLNNDNIVFDSADPGDTFTISAWIKPDPARTGIQTIFTNCPQGINSDGFRFFINAGIGFGSIAFETGNGTAGLNVKSVAGVIDFDQWNHVAAVVDRASGLATIYHNGIEVSTSNTILTDFNTSSDWRLGQMEDPASDFLGSIDEFRLLSVSHTAEEIEAEYLAQKSNSTFVTFGEEEVATADAAAPVILSVISTLGSNELTVTFSEAVDTSNLGSGDLITADFVYTDVSAGGATSISAMGADADGTDGVVLITLDAPLVAGDLNTDTLAAAANQIYDLANNPMGTSAFAVSLSGNTPATIGGDVSYSGSEGDAVAGTMTATDTDGLTDGTYFTVTTAPTVVGASANIDVETGAWTYTPVNADWFGSDTFTVTVTDDVGGTTTQVINITLANVDDPATIGGDVSYSGNEGDSPSGTMTATDVDGLTDTTYFSVTTAPTVVGSSANINAETGAWTYTPVNADWFGSDTFTVTVTDDEGGTTT